LTDARRGAGVKPTLEDAVVAVVVVAVLVWMGEAIAVALFLGWQKVFLCV
jgi:hypothetical protein